MRSFRCTDAMISLANSERLFMEDVYLAPGVYSILLALRYIARYDVVVAIQ